jgi:hypothetical protein
VGVGLVLILLEALEDSESAWHGMDVGWDGMGLYC